MTEGRYLIPLSIITTSPRPKKEVIILTTKTTSFLTFFSNIDFTLFGPSFVFLYSFNYFHRKDYFRLTTSCSMIVVPKWMWHFKCIPLQNNISLGEDQNLGSPLRFVHLNVITMILSFSLLFFILLVTMKLYSYSM